MFKRGRYILGIGGKKFLQALNNLFPEGYQILFYEDDPELRAISEKPIKDKRVFLYELKKLREMMASLSFNPFFAILNEEYKSLLKAVPRISFTPTFLNQLLAELKRRSKIQKTEKKRSFLEKLREKVPGITPPIEQKLAREIEKFVVERKEDLLYALDNKQLMTFLTERFKRKEITEEDFRLLKENIQIVLTTARRLQRQEKTLGNFKALVYSNPKEEAIQEFLRKEPWILGDEYYDAIPQKNVGTEQDRYITDFLLKDMFGLEDHIIELKKPSFKVTKEPYTKEERRPTANVLNAIWQGIGYIEENLIKNRRYSKVGSVNLSVGIFSRSGGLDFLNFTRSFLCRIYPNIFQFQALLLFVMPFS